MAWGINFATASRDSTAPAGLPGRLRIRAFPRTPQTPRLKAANRVFLRPSARMRSDTPSIRRSQTARVASGVTSRAAMPVPPEQVENLHRDFLRAGSDVDPFAREANQHFLNFDGIVGNNLVSHDGEVKLLDELGNSRARPIFALAARAGVAHGHDCSRDRWVSHRGGRLPLLLVCGGPGWV